MADADSRGLNDELGSGARVLPMTKDELDGWAALPVAARRRRVSGQFGEGGRVRVVPANGVVLEPAGRTPGAGTVPVRTREDERAEREREEAEARREEEESEAEEEASLRAAGEEAGRAMEGAEGAGLLTEEEEDYMRIVEGQEEEARALGEEGEAEEEKEKGRPQIRFEEGEEE